MFYYKVLFLKNKLVFIFLKILFIYFLERGEGKEKEQERNINVWLPPHMCPDWESNWRPFGLQAHAPSTEPYQSGLKNKFLEPLNKISEWL